MRNLPRLSMREVHVLTQLVSRPKYGLELVEDSDGILAKNAIYVLLGRMEDKGLIKGKKEDTPPGEMGPPRRRYAITGLGQRTLNVFEETLAKMKC